MLNSFLSISNIQELDEIIGGININLKDVGGRTLLFYAIIEKKAFLISYLLRKGAAINLKDNNGWSPLHFAAQIYDAEMVEYLVKNGAQIDIQDNYGNSPLWRAVFESRNRGEVIKLLLRLGANPELENLSGISPKNLAKNIKNYDILQFFD